MRNNRLHRALFVLVYCFPLWASALTLDPGQPGNFFTYTNAGTVDTLEANGFDIDFADGKFITITPYGTDSQFLFGIDFNGSGLDPVAIAGYLRDAMGNEIAGTAFTGTAISAGFRFGALVFESVQRLDSSASYGKLSFISSPGSDRRSRRAPRARARWRPVRSC